MEDEGCELPAKVLHTHRESHCSCRPIVVDCVHVDWATPTNNEAKAHCITLYLKAIMVQQQQGMVQQQQGMVQQ